MRMKTKPIVVCLLIAMLIPMIEYNAIASTDENPDYVLDFDHEVSTYEIYNSLTVSNDTKLVVTGVLEATNITVQNGSIIEIIGGTIILKDDDTWGGNVKFVGNCSYFNITNNGKLLLYGSNGTDYPLNHPLEGPFDAYILYSKGGDAIFNITVSEGIQFENSKIDIIAGNGSDLPASTGNYCNAWTTNVIEGWYAGGGNATFNVRLTNDNNNFMVNNSTFNISSGRGGKAADATLNVGGGYSNGNSVIGHIGKGGNVEVLFYANKIIIYNSSFNISSREGGDAGNGGTTKAGPDFGYNYGGGGGGYSGGNGAGYSISGPMPSANPGGAVLGEMGKGGDILFILQSELIDLYKSNFLFEVGNGGNAGGSSSGGGGYGGGGAGGWDGWRSIAGAGGNGGTIRGFVGAGGNLSFYVIYDSIEINRSYIFGKGGNGGKGGGNAGYGGGGTGALGGDTNVLGNIGQGGYSKVIFSGNESRFNRFIINITSGRGGEGGSPGGGGGGYGGGGWGVRGVGGDTSVSGSIGVGGNSTIIVQSYYIEMMNTSINSSAGDGGNGGVNLGGYGGGGYGGAGGGENGGGSCIVLSGNIGDGGSSDVVLDCQVIKITENCNIQSNPGKGGNGTDSPGLDYPTMGGEGKGRNTTDGNMTLIIPMSKPILISPKNNTMTNISLIDFKWYKSYYSSTNGYPTSYYIEIDDNNDFSSPIISFDIGVTDHYPNTLPEGTYYWRIKTMYGSASANWSEIWKVSIDTEAPTSNTPMAPGDYNNTGIVQWMWNPATDTGSGIEGYYVNITDDLNNNVVDDAWTSDTWYEESGLVNGRTYYCKVKAKNGAGAIGSYSDSSDGILVDLIVPSSYVNPIINYWQKNSYINIDATAVDLESGLSSVELWYRYSLDNHSWEAWTFYTADNAAPWSWNFSFLNGSGYYQFVTLSKDNASNKEYKDPSIYDSVVAYDNIPPNVFAGDDIIIDLGEIVYFDGSGSSDNSGSSGLTFSWDFDNSNGITTDANTTYASNIYTSTGTFIVTLTVHDKAGNYNSDTLLVYIVDSTNPIADAGSDQVVDEDTLVTVNASGSTDNNGTVSLIYAWDWDAGDGISIENNTLSAIHIYNIPGIYIVTLNVTDAGGNWDTDSLVITVRDITSPIADAGSERVENEDEVITFNASDSTDNSGFEHLDFHWDFDANNGIGIDAEGAITHFVYYEPGIYVVTLNVTDAAGNWDVVTVHMVVLDITNPIAVAGDDIEINEDIEIEFNAGASTDNNGTQGLTYSWDFDISDGIQVDGTVNIVTHTYYAPGTYIVTLNVSDASGNWAIDSVIVIVRDTTDPDTDAGLDQTVDEDTIITFNGSTSSDNVAIALFKWSFTDETQIILTGEKPSYIFNNPGIYVITLKTIDTVGNQDMDTATITVRDITSPVADAGNDLIIVEGTPIALNGSGTTDNNGILGLTYSWTSIIDGSTITLDGENPSYTFEIPGTYVITLNASDEAGNWDIDTIVVFTLPDADRDGISNTDDTDDDNDTIVDTEDAFPFDPNEDTDTDGDGVGDNADNDDDGDGVSDSDDEFPLDPTEWSDFDGDGIGDNKDPDDDNDGTIDTDDYKPHDQNAQEPPVSDFPWWLLIIGLIVGLLIGFLLSRLRGEEEIPAEEEPIGIIDEEEPESEDYEEITEGEDGAMVIEDEEAEPIEEKEHETEEEFETGEADVHEEHLGQDILGVWNEKYESKGYLSTICPSCFEEGEFEVETTEAGKEFICPNCRAKYVYKEE